MLVGDRVEVAASQQIPDFWQALGLTQADVMAQAWYVSADKKHLSGGAGAINDTLRHLWYLAPFTYLYRIPGLRQLEDWLYRKIADNRHKMPGASTACALPQSNAPQQPND